MTRRALPQPYYQDDAVTIYHGDCREIMLHLPKVDAVVTDPPYGIKRGSAFVRSGGKTIRKTGASVENDLVDGWFGGAVWSIRSGGYLATFHVQGEVFETDGWRLRPFHRFYLVKQAPAPCPRNAFQSGVEECSIFIRTGDGERYWGGGGATPNYWIGLTPNRLNQSHGHEFEKPLPPMRTLVKCLCPEGGYTLDPFMGSGTTLRAAKDLGRKAIGIEIEERYCEIAAKRMSQEVLPL